MPLLGAQTPNTPAQLIQIVVCKYLHLHKHLCLTVCHGGNTSEASSLRKEMSLSLLTLPPLHIAQAPLHHPSARKVSNTLYFQLVLCQREEKQFQEEEAYLHVRCLLFAAPFYRSSFLPLAASQPPAVAHQIRAALPVLSAPDPQPILKLPRCLPTPCCLCSLTSVDPLEKETDGLVGRAPAQDLKSSGLSSYDTYSVNEGFL